MTQKMYPAGATKQSHVWCQHNYVGCWLNPKIHFANKKVAEKWTKNVWFSPLPLWWRILSYTSAIRTCGSLGMNAKRQLTDILPFSCILYAKCKWCFQSVCCVPTEHPWETFLVSMRCWLNATFLPSRSGMCCHCDHCSSGLKTYMHLKKNFMHKSLTSDYTVRVALMKFANVFA